MKKLFVLTLFFLNITLLAQNIPSLEVEAELEEFKKKDDLRAYIGSCKAEPHVYWSFRKKHRDTRARAIPH